MTDVSTLISISGRKKAYLVFTVDRITATDAPSDGATSRRRSRSRSILPIGPALSVRTVSGHMTRVATDATDDISCEVTLLGTVVFTMPDLTAFTFISIDPLMGEATLTILTSLILIVTKSTVEGREFTELVTLQLVLTFGDRCSLVSISQQTVKYPASEANRFDDVVNQLLRFIDLFLGIGHDQTVEIFFLVAGVSCVRSTLSFFDGSFATDGNLCE